MPEKKTQPETCDLCIIGAGIAGLNALHVASEYLGKDKRIILVDRNDRPGGMWTETYDFVRLHQPHPMFTTGDVTWDWSKPRNYLATRDEVQGHLARCAGLAAKRTGLDTFFGYSFEEVKEVQTPQGTRVHVRCRSSEDTIVIDAARMINAIGVNVKGVAPLTLESRSVHSTTPQALTADGSLEGEGPVYVVGAGKTGMDTVLMVLRSNPDREVHLLSGKGTMFARRDLLMPDGMKRWFGGYRLLSVFQDLAMRFDGDNEDNVRTHARGTYCLEPGGETKQFLYGLLSDDELDAVEKGLSSNTRDYLDGVTDGPDGPLMQLRTGGALPVPEGAVFVNCTGHIFREPSPSAPLLSESGAVLNIGARDAFHFLTSVSAYFLTHLWYLGTLKNIPFYTMDLESLFMKNRTAWVAATSAQAFYNTVQVVQHAPFKVADKCGLDFDRWYPLHRRLAGLIDIKRNHRRYSDHCISAMDRVRARYDLSGGLLTDRQEG